MAPLQTPVKVQVLLDGRLKVFQVRPGQSVATVAAAICRDVGPRTDVKLRADFANGSMAHVKDAKYTRRLGELIAEHRLKASAAPRRRRPPPEEASHLRDVSQLTLPSGLCVTADAARLAVSEDEDASWALRAAERQRERAPAFNFAGRGCRKSPKKVIIHAPFSYDRRGNRSRARCGCDYCASARRSSDSLERGRDHTRRTEALDLVQSLTRTAAQSGKQLELCAAVSRRLHTDHRQGSSALPRLDDDWRPVRSASARADSPALPAPDDPPTKPLLSPPKPPSLLTVAVTVRVPGTA